MCRLFNIFVFTYRNHSLMSPTSWLINEKNLPTKTVGPSSSMAEETTAIQIQKNIGFLQKKKTKRNLKTHLGGSCFTPFFPSNYPGIHRYTIFSPHRVAFAPLHPKYSSCNPVALHHLRHVPKIFFTAFRLVDFGFPEKYY